MKIRKPNSGAISVPILSSKVSSKREARASKVKTIVIILTLTKAPKVTKVHRTGWGFESTTSNRNSISSVRSKKTVNYRRSRNRMDKRKSTLKLVTIWKSKKKIKSSSWSVKF